MANIRGFGELCNRFLRMLGLSVVPSGRSLVDYEHDIDVLATHYRRGDLFSFTPGRSQSFSALDTFSEGYEKLVSGTLVRFLDRTITDPDQISDNNDLESAGDNEQLAEPPVPLVSENGVLRAGDGPALDALLNLYS
ncbi:hypothetical protein FRC12_004895 [Ceratobasidium sp. 428]|nr:hypothetical protein FRC12_004895 [Ceratobasidium sp. 428]